MVTYSGALSMLRVKKPTLVRTFEDYHTFTGGAPRTDAPADVAYYLTLASEFVFVAGTTVERALKQGELPRFVHLLYTLSRSSPSCAAVFSDFYAVSAYRLDDLYPALMGFAAQDLRSAHHAEKLLRMSLDSTSVERVLAYVRLFTEMISRAPGAVEEFLVSFSDMKRRFEWTVLEEWLRRGADLISIGRIEEGVHHLLAKSRESRTLLGIKAAVLDDLKKVLQIYCTSIGGRSFGIQSTAISTFGISEPYTDGKTVFLPARVDFFESIQENELAYTAIAALQAAQIKLGTLSFTNQGLSFQTEIRTRYALVLPDVMEHVRKQYEEQSEAIRERATGETEVLFAGERVIEVLATPHEQFFYQFPTPDLMRELFSLVESYRVEHVLASRYHGLREDFSRLNQRILANAYESEGPGGDVPSAIGKIIRITLGDTVRGENTTGRGRRLIPVVEEALELLRRPGTTVQDSAQAAFTIYNVLYESYSIIPWCRRNDVRGLFRGVVKSCLQPEIAFDVSPELFAGVKEKPIPEELEEQDIQDIDLTSFTKTEKKAQGLREAILNGEVTVYRYHEYDSERGRTLKKHCTLYESALQSGDAEFYTRTLKENNRIYRRLKKRFLMMQPEELELSRRWLQGDEIHLGDAFDFTTDIMRGTTPDSKIYQRRKRNRRDIAAAILLDASSSTEEKVGGEQIISVEKKALCLLAGVLAPIGDTFGIFSYFSMGRHNNFFMVAKDFDERWDERAQGKIAGIEASSSNRDGCAIRHATARLAERPEKTKLLLLLSDGIPADAGYGSKDGSETTRYAIEDTRKAVLDAKISGVIPYCITIDRSARSYIPHLYGDYHYAVIGDVGELPEKLSRLYLRLTH